MSTTQATVEQTVQQVYAAFNRRDIDTALALMTAEVSWPKASEGGRVTGKQEIRAYWTRQWAAFSPVVKPIALHHEPGNRVRVRVHQLVRDLDGHLLSDSEVLHVFTVEDGLISAMHLGDEAGLSTNPSAAFSHRH